MGFFPPNDRIDFSQQPPAPANQQAAMPPKPPSSPSPDQIAQVVAFCNVDAALAARYLRAKDNDADAAAGAIFDGEDIARLEAGRSWDEGLWGRDREGGGGEGAGGGLQSLAAGTRPNSPAKGVGGSGSGWGPHQQPSSKQQYDDDMARAIAMSQGVEAGEVGGGGGGGVYGQETGTVGAKEFGPATREHYDASEWAMVPTGGGAGAREIVPDAEVLEQVRGTGQPGMLKFLPDGDYLASFLTICGSVLGAREALLCRDLVAGEYGWDEEWWKGQAVAVPQVVNLSDGSAAGDDLQEEGMDAVKEVQRLMAFLVAGKRSYASAGALAQTDAMSRANLSSTQSRTWVEAFLQLWTNTVASKSTEHGDQLKSVFTTTVGTNAPEGMGTPDLHLIDMQVSLGEGEKSDLFEQLDALLWETDGDNSSLADNYISRPAEVLVMRAHQASSTATQLRLDVPAEFHIDKYLPGNVAATRVTRQEMASGKRRIAKIEQIEQRLRTWKHPKNSSKSLDAGALLTHTLNHFSGRNAADAWQADRDNNIPVPAEPEPSPQHYPQVAQTLEALMASIDAKLTLLGEEKEKTRQAVAAMSKAPPPGMTEDQLKHRYTLRGVATKPSITYVLTRKSTRSKSTTTTTPADPPADAPPSPPESTTGHPIDNATTTNAADDDIDPDDNTPPGWQWHRLEYEVSPTGGAHILRSRAADYDVLRAVELEHSNVLLVYASDAACGIADDDDDSSSSDENDTNEAEESAPAHAPDDDDDDTTQSLRELPSPLRAFTTADNAAFTRQLAAARHPATHTPHTTAVPSDAPPAYSFDSHPATRGGSPADSTRAEGGDSPPGFGGEGFFGREGFGLGPEGVAAGAEVGGEETVHEIRLEPEEGEGVEVEREVGAGREMEEKGGRGLFSGAKALTPGQGDGGGERSEMGRHVEHAGSK